ncbi:random slug protein 5-like [Dorcoceras hygrometricum]|uniref:Random slug protein 5-like n=1 Tax=Dorcoceras hygrometricum TaxID=472368 RepID=A0A2Z7C308_9LAMI|nr:random slug protein 5-like [Dorcoceras hygrometricum]
MTSSRFVNALQVAFESVLTLEHTNMTRMFKSLEDTGLKGFLEVPTSFYEDVVTEIFVNAKVIAGTIGMTGFLDLPKDTVMETRSRFSATDVPFRAPSKKREMKVEYQVLTGDVGASGDEHVDVGPRRHERTEFEQAERMSGDYRKLNSYLKSQILPQQISPGHGNLSPLKTASSLVSATTAGTA